MSISRLKEQLLSSLVPLVCLGFIAYLGYHGLYGKNGIMRYFQLQQQKERLQYELSMVEAERIKLETRIKNLRDEPLDLDLLEESAHRVLGMAYPDEVIVHQPQGLVDMP